MPAATDTLWTSRCGPERKSVPEVSASFNFVECDREGTIKLRELTAEIEQAVITGDPDTEIEQVEYDSRLIKNRALFVAIKGYQHDGYDFVAQAIEKGAIAVLGEREECESIEHHVSVPNARIALAQVAAAFYGHPGRKIKACGVTGTNGKTTTCHLIRNILQARNKTTGLISSQIYDTGRERFDSVRTTPESLDIQRLLFLMKKNWCVNAVIEVSSHALTLHRVDEINFRVAVYTNLTRDHLDFHDSMDEYLEAKAKLIERLDGPLSYAVINLDVPEFRQLLGRLKSSHIGYSLEDDSADVYCANYELEPDRTNFDLVTPMGMRTITLQLPGRFNLINAVAAASGGLASGVDIDNVVRGLERSQPIPGRFNYIDSGQPFAVYVDFAHTSDAIQRLCESARELSEGGKLYIMFGCGGDRDKGKRPLMGKAATTNADFAVLTSDNPRSEDPNAIIEEVKAGIESDNYEVVPDRKEAIKTILSRAKSGDIVLLAGKGAEPYQEIQGERTPFSDIETARQTLAELGYSPQASTEEQ
ncbi:UDP-N-acetylmuramoyl-L-alanyl-D-glutamate--2,6-diaminopimelate ligase [candidate division GN15 bacterium]|nr:UDP-N-acetylmuramoyl-L-alanyl-D-glutamate--2,6-diaminopimelate ligase [candidate division GN15 bacterium]